MRWKRLAEDSSGTGIAEFAVLLPVAVFLALGFLDLQLLTMNASDVDYIANEVSRCEAISQLSPVQLVQPNTPCVPPQGTAVAYAEKLARDLRLKDVNLSIDAPPCSPVSDVCTVTLNYRFHALGVWFPAVNIVRTGTASYVPAP